MLRVSAMITLTVLVSGWTVTNASAVDILVAMSLKTSGYNRILNAAQSSCSQIKMATVNLSDNAEVNLPQLVRSTRSKAVIALGDKAYELANTTLRSPIIGAMVSNSKNQSISFIAPPEMFLVSLKKKLGKRQIGVIHSNQMSSYVRQSADIARQYGIKIISREINSPSEALESFSELKGLIDCLWILPDTKAINSGTAQVLLRGAHNNNIPVIAFSRSYLNSGAVMVIEADYEAIGRSIGEVICTMQESNFTLDNRYIYREFWNEPVLARLGLSKTPSR